MTEKQRAIIAMTISAIAFSLMGVFLKLTGDVPTTQKTFFRSIVIMSCSFFMFKSQGLKIKNIRHIKLLTLRSALGTIGILFNYYALDHLILSDANVIFRLSTIFLLITSYIFLKEKLHSYQFLSMCIAFIGVIFIIKPSFSFDFFPYLIGLLGALFAAFAYTTVRVLGKKEHPVSVVLYFSTFTGVVLLIPTLFNFTPMTLLQLVYALLTGFFAFLGQMGVTIAYKHAPAKEVSIYGYLGVIFSALFSIVLFKGMPDMMSYIGYFLVFASSYYLYKRNISA